MAIYHLSAQIIGRSSGRSSVAASAYRAGEELRDERTGRSHDYSRRRDIDSWIQVPAGAPDWARDRAELWNRVEASERRSDSQLAREINVALPVELPRERQDELLRGYVGEQFVGRGMVADVAVHRQDLGNPHAHVMLTTREIDPEGFGRKAREWNRPEELAGWREAWAERCNRELERCGREERIDHRSHEDRGLDREPTVHEGPDVREMEARGIPTERGDRNREVRARNAWRDRRDEADREARGREEGRWRDPVERRAEAWRGIGYGEDTARTLARLERERGREYRTDAEAWEELGGRRDALHRDGRALREERREHGRLEGYGGRCREAREEYDRARRELEHYGRELGRAGVYGPEDLARRGEGLRAREGAHRAREETWGPYDRAWAEIGGAMEARREAERRAEREREWERRDRERGDPPGTARARDEADRDDWCP